ncbi:MAG: hypothetical protein KAW52_00375 [candidate division Zixibacteria bacterium]|nr:hypothetical protein [candidate division Zixibacteria bacterium]
MSPRRDTTFSIAKTAIKYSTGRTYKMDIPEKCRFINELINNVQMEVVERVRDMPEDWDGRELRWYIAEKFNEAIFDRDKRGKRYQDYKNFIITTGNF